MAYTQARFVDRGNDEQIKEDVPDQKKDNYDQRKGYDGFDQYYPAHGSPLMKILVEVFVR